MTQNNLRYYVLQKVKAKYRQSQFGNRLKRPLLPSPKKIQGDLSWPSLKNVCLVCRCKNLWTSWRHSNFGLKSKKSVNSNSELTWGSSLIFVKFGIFTISSKFYAFNAIFACHVHQLYCFFKLPGTQTIVCANNMLQIAKMLKLNQTWIIEKWDHLLSSNCQAHATN